MVRAYRLLLFDDVENCPDFQVQRTKALRSSLNMSLSSTALYGGIGFNVLHYSLWFILSLVERVHGIRDPIRPQMYGFSLNFHGMITVFLIKTSPSWRGGKKRLSRFLVGIGI